MNASLDKDSDASIQPVIESMWAFPIVLCVLLSPFGCVTIKLNLRWCTAVCERAELRPPHQTHLPSYSLPRRGQIRLV